MSNADLKKVLTTYTQHWKWFMISCVLCIALAFIHLRYTPSEYNANAKIMLVDDSGVSNPAEELLKDLGRVSSGDSKEIEDEIQVLKSRKLLKGVVKKLKLNKQLFSQGRIHETEYYPINKAPIKVSLLEHDSIIDAAKFNCRFKINSSTSFDYIYETEAGEEKIIKAYFGKNIKTSIGEILVTPNTSDLSNYFEELVFYNITPVSKLAEGYKKKIEVLQTGEFSKVLILSLNEKVANKAKEILNTVVSEYNRTSIEEKQEKSNNTSEFINKRINAISSDLGKVDDEIEQFKTGNKLTNISSEADLFLKSNAQTEQNLAIARTEYNKINFMKSQLDINSFERIPANIGLANASVNSIANKYNELLENRNRLLKSSNEKNPIIVNLDQELVVLKQSLNEGLNNSSETVGLQIKSLENRISKTNSKIYAVPGQVRKSRDIEREQGIKESLYLYLLQKREEASISLISTSPNAKIIDRAHSTNIPVSPNQPLTYIASLIIGLGIPFGIFYFKNLLDTKIHNKEDLENEIDNITVLGEVPHFSGSKSGKLIKKNDRSVLSESFRIIRTNLDYVRRSRSSEKYDNVIFITSTINSEGKSFFSMNMALTLANTNKRVLLIGADIRNPQTDSILSTKKKKVKTELGLTEYLVDKSILVGEVVNSFDINGNSIDVMASGKVPPNPSELLMSDRMEELFHSISDQYDYVIVDTAPAMLVTDTLLISKYAGHTIYVTRAGYTEKRILNFAKELHTDNKLNGMMLVVNDVKQSNFGYGAKYGYYGAPEKKGLFGRLFKKAS